MENRDRIASLALAVSIVALAVAAGSAAFTGKQYWLNQARDEREREARLPTFDHSLTKQREGREWKLTGEILNRNDAKLTFDFVAIEGPPGARLAPPDARGNPEPTSIVHLPGIAPHATATWTAYIIIDDQSPGGRGKQARLTYAFRFIDASEQIEKTFYVSLP
jgi:hypothetical protein